MPFNSFSCLYAMATTSSIMLHRNGEQRPHCHEPDHRKEEFGLFVWCSFRGFVGAPYLIEEVSLYSSFADSFVTNFWRSEILKQLSWTVLAQGLLWGCNRAVCQGYGLWRFDWNWRIHFRAQSEDCWQEAAVSHHVSLSIDCSQYDFPGSNWEEGERERENSSTLPLWPSLQSQTTTSVLSGL